MLIFKNMSKNKNTDINRRKRPPYMKYIGISSQLVILCIIGIWLGIFLNEKVGHSPLFLILCPIVFLFVGLYSFIRGFMKDLK